MNIRNLSSVRYNYHWLNKEKTYVDFYLGFLRFILLQLFINKLDSKILPEKLEFNFIFSEIG